MKKENIKFILLLILGLGVIIFLASIGETTISYNQNEQIKDESNSKKTNKNEEIKFKYMKTKIVTLPDKYDSKLSIEIIRETSDGFLLSCLTREDYKHTIIKTDYNFNVLWELDIYKDSIINIFDFIINNDGTIFGIGGYNSTNFNATTTTSTENKIESNLFSFIIGRDGTLLQTNDTNLIITKAPHMVKHNTGYLISTNINKSASIVELNESGNITNIYNLEIFEDEYDEYKAFDISYSTSKGTEYIYDILALHKGGYLIFSKVGFHHFPVVTKLDKNLNTQWKKLRLGTSTFSRMSQTENEILQISQNKLFIFDKDGKIELENEFTIDDHDLDIFSLVKRPNNLYSCIGQDYIITLDSNSNIVKYKQFKDETIKIRGNYRYNSLLVTRNNDNIVISYNEELGKYTFHINPQFMKQNSNYISLKEIEYEHIVHDLKFDINQSDTKYFQYYGEKKLENDIFFNEISKGIENQKTVILKDKFYYSSLRSNRIYSFIETEKYKYIILKIDKYNIGVGKYDRQNKLIDYNVLNINNEEILNLYSKYDEKNNSLLILIESKREHMYNSGISLNFLTLDSNLEISNLRNEESIRDKSVIDVSYTVTNDIVVLWRANNTRYITICSYDNYMTFSFNDTLLRANIITTDSLGNIYIGGEDKIHSKVVKLDMMGNVIWTKSFNQKYNIKDINITLNNEVVVISQSRNNIQNTIIVTKLDNLGNVISNFRSINNMYFLEGTQNNRIIGFYAKMDIGKKQKIIYCRLSDDLDNTYYIELRGEYYLKIFDKELYKKFLESTVEKMELKNMYMFSHIDIKLENSNTMIVDMFENKNTGTWLLTRPPIAK